MSPPSKYLATYLNDHLGGSTFGVELVRRSAAEIDADRKALKAIMAELGVKADRAKVAVGWAAEKMGRLKPNAQLRGYSPLSPLVELEGLLVGIQGKLSLWRALAEVAAPLGLDPARLQGLAARALSQQAGIAAVSRALLAFLVRHGVEVSRSAGTGA